jgi:hypothetical protein
MILLSDPEPWPGPITLGPVLNAIRTAVKRFVIVSESAAVAITLWIIHSYTHDSANVSPILAVNSPEKRCGKTTLLELLTAHCPPRVAPDERYLLFTQRDRAGSDLMLIKDFVPPR